MPGGLFHMLKGNKTPTIHQKSLPILPHIYIHTHSKSHPSHTLVNHRFFNAGQKEEKEGGWHC